MYRILLDLIPLLIPVTIAVTIFFIYSPSRDLLLLVYLPRQYPFSYPYPNLILFVLIFFSLPDFLLLVLIPFLLLATIVSALLLIQIDLIFPQCWCF